MTLAPESTTPIGSTAPTPAHPKTPAYNGYRSLAEWCRNDPELDAMRWETASLFIGAFGGTLIDQASLPQIAAGLAKTGRFTDRDENMGRLLRTAIADQVAFWGDEEDRQAEYKRLKKLHGEVKGEWGGVRYSALSPENWNFVLISTFFGYRNAIPAITGKRYSPREDEKFWQFFRAASTDVQLPGRGALPATFAEAERFFEDTVNADYIKPNRIVDDIIEGIRKPGMPWFFPEQARPLWNLLGPIAGHVVLVCSLGIMHPRVKAITNYTWTARHDLEFFVITRLMRIGNRVLPKRLTWQPLAYNRWTYERHVRAYLRSELTSFKPISGWDQRKADAARRAAGCPA